MCLHATEAQLQFSGHGFSGLRIKQLCSRRGASGLLLLARDLEACCPARYRSQVVAHFSPILSGFARLQPSLIMESTAFAGPRFLFAPAVD